MAIGKPRIVTLKLENVSLINRFFFGFCFFLSFHPFLALNELLRSHPGITHQGICDSEDFIMKGGILVFSLVTHHLAQQGREQTIRLHMKSPYIGKLRNV